MCCFVHVLELKGDAAQAVLGVQERKLGWRNVTRLVPTSSQLFWPGPWGSPHFPQGPTTPPAKPSGPDKFLSLPGIPQHPERGFPSSDVQFF